MAHRPPSGWQWPCLAPDVLGYVDDEAELRLLVVQRQRIALRRRGEAALAGQAELVERHVFRRFVDAALEVVRGFELRALCGDQAQHHLLARRHETQRLEPAGPLIVEFEEE